MPEVSAPESAGTVIAYTTINGSNSHGDLSANAPIRSATKAELNITAVMARWRPNRNAHSLPRMLAGIASTENSTLTTTGVRSEASDFFMATNVQNATSQVLMP